MENTNAKTLIALYTSLDAMHTLTVFLEIILDLFYLGQYHVYSKTDLSIA